MTNLSILLFVATLIASNKVSSFSSRHAPIHRRTTISMVSTQTGLSKIEGVAVDRFTIGYDKLCKSCPTRLQPRAGTLAEMILGLPIEERNELMDTVAKRLEEEENHNANPLVKSSRDVYDFQTAGVSIQVKEKKIKAENSSVTNAPSMGTVFSSQQDDIDIVDAKLLKKMRKVRSSFESNKMKLAKARRLLAVTNALLSKDTLTTEPTIYTVPNPLDNAWYHDIDHLKSMQRGELKMERLKLTAQKAKYFAKVAKGRLKLYKASVDLMDHNNHVDLMDHVNN